MRVERLRPWRLAALILLAAWWPPALAGQTPAAPPGDLPELVVHAPAPYEALGARIQASSRQRLAVAMRLVGLHEAGPPIQVFLAEEGSARGRAVPGWAAGYARGSEVVLLPERSTLYPDRSLEALLHHEVAHVLLARATGGRPVPRWFNEGVAMAAGRAWGLEDRTRMVLEAFSRERPSLAAVDELFSQGAGAAGRAYALAGAFVQDLQQQHGAWVSGEILRRVGEGMSFEDAFYESTGTSLRVAEARFWKRRGGWERWFPFLSSSLTLWIAISLLALYAFKRRRDRDAEMRAHWEQEEEKASGRSLWRSSDPHDGDSGSSSGPQNLVH